MAKKTVVKKCFAEKCFVQNAYWIWGIWAIMIFCSDALPDYPLQCKELYNQIH